MPAATTACVLAEVVPLKEGTATTAVASDSISKAMVASSRPPLRPPRPPTLPLLLGADPCEMSFDKSAALVRAVMTEAAFGVPRPVARSYPAVAAWPLDPLVTSFRSWGLE